MKKASICFLLLSFLHFFGLSQTEEVIQTDTSKWATFSEGMIGIDYPEDWELQSPGQMGTTFILFSPIQDEADQFRENINLMIQDLSGYQMTLDQYVESSEQQIQNMIMEGKILESERVDRAGNTFHKIIFTGKQGVYNLKFEQQYRIVKEKAYVLTLTCDVRSFDDYKALGEQILRSFRIQGARKD